MCGHFLQDVDFFMKCGYFLFWSMDIFCRVWTFCEGVITMTHTSVLIFYEMWTFLSGVVSVTNVNVDIFCGVWIL